MLHTRSQQLAAKAKLLAHKNEQKQEKARELKPAGGNKTRREVANKIYQNEPSISKIESDIRQLAEQAKRDFNKLYQVTTGITIQHRFWPFRMSMDRTWEEYKNGFASGDGEMWFGLKNVHELMKKATYRLRIELVDGDDQFRWAQYDNFRIGSEFEKYKITAPGDGIQAYGTLLGDDPLWVEKTARFYTNGEDDNDARGDRTAAKDGGGWWFNPSHQKPGWICNLNAGKKEALKCVKRGSGDEWITNLKMTKIIMKRVW